MNEEVKSIISLIKEANLKNKISVWLPCAQKYVSLIPFTTSHQKTFVQNLLDSPFVNSLFTVTSAKALNDCWIIEDNGAFEPDKLKVLDKYTMLKHLLIHSYDTENHTKYKEFLKKENESKLVFESIKPEYSFIKYGEYEITLGFPSILVEAQHAQYIHEWVKNNFDSDNNATLHELNSILYISDGLQYIKEIKIGENVINFESLDVVSKNDIGLNLPSSIIEKIIENVSSGFEGHIRDVKTLINSDAKTEEDRVIYLKLENADFVIS